MRPAGTAFSNMRDHATIIQLLVPANIEGMNAEFIHMGLQRLAIGSVLKPQRGVILEPRV